MRKESSKRVKPIKAPKKKIMVRRPYRGEFDPDYVIKRLKKLAKKLGRFPKHQEIAQDFTLPYYKTINKYFGSYQKIAEITGYPYVKHQHTKEELLNLLKLKTKELGRAPTQREMIRDRPRMPNPSVYRCHFGFWAKAVELIGHKAPKIIPYTLEDFKRALKKFYRKYHRSPTIEEFNKVKDFPSTGALEKFGKTWNQMLAECGLPLNIVSRYSLDDFKKAVKTFYHKYKRPPLARDFVKNSKFPSPNVLKRFGKKWNQLLTECKLPIGCRRDSNFSVNRKVEVFVKRKLMRLGHKVLDLTEQGYFSPYSLLLNNKIRIHVAGATQRSPKGKKRIIWVFCVPREKEFDYMIAVGMNDYSKPGDLFVLPANEITANILEIPVYAHSKYSRYYVPNLKEIFPLKSEKRKR